jgi:hypothetical protein
MTNESLKLNKVLSSKFCSLFKTSVETLFIEDIWYFRYICFKYNYFLKHLVLPKFKKQSLYESVFIEFRILPHIEFLIRNSIFKLGPKWSHTIVCGSYNYDYVYNICKNISNDITIINTNIQNMTQNEYNNYLLTINFWEQFYGEKLLIYQEDSIIFKHNIDDFLDYDFIGAPFPKYNNDTPNLVGNGGLSIRSKSKILEILKNYNIDDFIINSSTINYMKTVKLTNPPEDVYFSKSMQENNIGIVSNWDVAMQFSSEAVFNPNSCAGHKFWISASRNEWKKKMYNDFNFNRYKVKSNIVDYLKYNKKPLYFNKTKSIPNAFDIDLYFFCKANNLEYATKKDSINYMNKIGMDGFIYHPKQLFNIFSDIELYTFLNNIYVFYNKQIFTIQNFTNKYIYDVTFDMLSNILIKKIYSCLNNNYDILFLVFIGNETKGVDLLERIIKYKKIQKDFNVSFCFNSMQVLNSPQIKRLIKYNFDFYSIYLCKEHGTDIVPTLLMYKDISKTYNFTHVFKFHTKSIHQPYLDLTNYLLSMPIEKLIVNKNDSCNCIGHPNYYIQIKNDPFNDILKKKHTSKIDLNKMFVGGTIFYSNSNVLDATIKFIINNNYNSYLLNNLYENNSINYDNSPIHFLERVFGTINL